MKKLFSLLSILFAIVAYAQDKPEGLFINSKAPDFRLKDQNDEWVSLKDLRKKGPVVVLFYRGYWCPYCNRELKSLQDSLKLIKDKGATLVAISPETSVGIDSTIGRTGATFSLLSDQDGKLADAYQVALKVDDKTVNRYKMAGIDLLKTNNQKEAVLPVTAVYIVNKEGTVTYRYFEENYRKQPPVTEILKNIK